MVSLDARHFAVRAATVGDLAALPEIEQQAHTIAYGMAGLGAVAELPPATVERLRHGPCWVALDRRARIVGFVLVGRVGHDAMIETLAILPEYSGSGLGRALIGAAIDWARQSGAAGMLVGAYRDIPWDAPFYARLGFGEVPRRQWSQEMHRLRREETVAGHDPERRLWMRLALG